MRWHSPPWGVQILCFILCSRKGSVIYPLFYLYVSFHFLRLQFIIKHVAYEKLNILTFFFFFSTWILVSLAESWFIWTFQLSHFGISGTSLWYDWIILLGIFVSSGCKGISYSPTYRYPFWACNKISCMARTSHYAAVYSPWTILCNCMDNWGQS